MLFLEAIPERSREALAVAAAPTETEPLVSQVVLSHDSKRLQLAEANAAEVVPRVPKLKPRARAHASS
jgi:hypothetical protein